MHPFLIFIAPVAFLSLTACTPAPDLHSSRSDAAPLNFIDQSAEVERMEAQTKALTSMSKRIVVQTTLKGAGIGAAISCGLVVVSSSNAKSCIAAAATGAAGGAAIGYISGKAKVNRRIEKVSPSAVVRTLRKTNDQMSLVQGALPARLAAQEEGLAQLDLKRAAGAIDQKTYVAGRAAIASERQNIAAALIETERNAKQAAANLRAAEAEGQTGLHWHIGAASKLAREAVSARSSISLL